MTREEAIKVAYGIFGTKAQHEALQFLIPELRESEDERIRRELLEYAKGEVRSYDNMVSGDYDSRDKEDKMMHKWWKKIVVYLEKQKALSELGKYIASERTKPGFMFSGNDSVSWEELPLQVRKHDYPYYFIGDLDCYPFVVEDKKPVECSKNNKDKSILTILVDALKGNAQLEWELKSAGVDVKRLVAYIEEQKEPTEELSIRLNGLMQEYVKSGKDEEEQEHRLKCYQLFWDALGDSEFFEQKEQKPDDVKREWWNKGYLEGRKNAHIPARELGLPSSWDFQKEQKSAEWSEDIIRKAVKEVGLTQHQINWFKNNVFPPKQEWSEEDEEIKHDIELCIEFFLKNGSVIAPSCNTKKEDALKWLKSLHPQPHWKPSEKQMEALKNCAYGAFRNGDGPVLRELYNDLKKL